MSPAKSLVIVALAFSLASCSKKDGDSGSEPVGSESAGVAGQGEGQGQPDDTNEQGKEVIVPKDTEVIELDQDGNAIPATIEVPLGSSVFADEPTTLRVSYGDGTGFGVQVAAGNEFNVNLKETADMLREGGYGATHEILEESPTLLRWTSTRDGHSSQSFDMLVELKGSTWVCKQGNMGGWNETQIAAQMAACKTLKAK